ncbi:methyltransferase-like protein 22 [Oscarella lobularis]|uniref:methyltransferase-like protein 22 n=1 Tax=Oscarella lobularis TaxID=121494 RepID=UPI00331355E6
MANVDVRDAFNESSSSKSGSKVFKKLQSWPGFSKENHSGKAATKRSFSDPCLQVKPASITANMPEVPRRAEMTSCLEHAMATRLKDVGQQVWNGALLMADFILSNKELFIGTCAIELGAGTGLTSLVLSQYADLVFCTDVGDGILSCCQRNVERNIGEIDAGIIRVRALNWADPDAPEGSPSSFGWTAADID